MTLTREQTNQLEAIRDVIGKAATDQEAESVKQTMDTASREQWGYLWGLYVLEPNISSYWNGTTILEYLYGNEKNKRDSAESMTKRDPSVNLNSERIDHYLLHMTNHKISSLDKAIYHISQRMPQWLNLKKEMLSHFATKQKENMIHRLQSIDPRPMISHGYQQLKANTMQGIQSIDPRSVLNKCWSVLKKQESTIRAVSQDPIYLESRYVAAGALSYGINLFIKEKIKICFEQEILVVLAGAYALKKAISAIGLAAANKLAEDNPQAPSTTASAVDGGGTNAQPVVLETIRVRDGI